jgi:two-component system CheB/CheR fusion protein
MDLISCRNLLIYLEPRLQERVFATFHYALGPSGFLMLGPAEGVGASSALFAPVDEKHKIYSRRMPAVPAHFHFLPGPSAGARPRTAVTPAPEAALGSEVPREADRLLLARYGPAGVVVDEGLDILEFRGDTDPFLEHAHGQASLNLIQMARKGLLVELRQAIEEARKKDAPSRKEGLRIRYRGQVRNVSLEVIPIKGRAAAAHCLLVLFETHRESSPAARRAPRVPSPLPVAKAKDREIEGLKRKLAETAEYLNTVAHEHEAALEELQSTNEEALSSNEELQSVNEELQTAKEEIQSANEELSTLNQELQDRNVELAQANDDLLNLLGSVNIPIVMVGHDLRVRRFTPAAEKLFSLIPTDIGRPLGDLRTALEAPELVREVRDVIDTVRVSEREVRDGQGAFYVMRIWPYLTREHKVDGALVVLLDVDALKRSAEQVKRALDAANAVVATVREPLLILDGELRIEKANRAFYQSFHVVPEETQGRPFWELGSGQWDRPDLRAALEGVLARDGSLEDFEIEHELPEIGRRTMALNARRLHHEPGGSGRILLAIEDRTEAKRTERRREVRFVEEQEARERAEAADQRKDELVATVSHELRAPLTTIGGWVQILSEAKLDPATLAKGLEAMGRGVKAQERLIADLLDHSRIVFGQIRLSRDSLDLVAIAASAIASVRAAAEAKGIHLELSGDHVGSVVLGDGDRIQQVLWNLLFNAIKFTPSGGRIHIGVGRVGTHVQLTVRDTGEGIPAALLPHLFESFRRGHEALGHRQAGLGLGLTLVRELVELHGGTVRAESAGEGQGATFTIALPAPG